MKNKNINNYKNNIARKIANKYLIPYNNIIPKYNKAAINAQIKIKKLDSVSQIKMAILLESLAGNHITGLVKRVTFKNRGKAIFVLYKVSMNEKRTLDFIFFITNFILVRTKKRQKRLRINIQILKNKKQFLIANNIFINDMNLFYHMDETFFQDKYFPIISIFFQIKHFFKIVYKPFPVSYDFPDDKVTKAITAFYYMKNQMIQEIFKKQYKKRLLKINKFFLRYFSVIRRKRFRYTLKRKRIERIKKRNLLLKKFPKKYFIKDYTIKKIKPNKKIKIKQISNIYSRKVIYLRRKKLIKKRKL